MPFLVLAKILETLPGVKREGTAFLLPEELDTAVFVSLGQEVLQVPRVARVELGTDVVLFVTHKGERFYFPPEQVMGLKFGGPDAKMTRLNAGFR
jgi:hypothetical protein